MRAIIENMILPDCVLCYLPRVLEIFWEKMIFDNLGFFLSKVLEKFGNYILGEARRRRAQGCNSFYIEEWLGACKNAYFATSLCV